VQQVETRNKCQLNKLLKSRYGDARCTPRSKFFNVFNVFELILVHMKILGMKPESIYIYP